MECKNEHFRHILLPYFRKGKKAAQDAKKLRNVYSEEPLKDNVEIGLINSVLGKVMLHPPYNPDLAPSDYYLFRSLQNSLNG